MSASFDTHLAPALAVPMAWALDHCFGEPRDALHPVAWLGRIAAPVGHRLKRASPLPAFVGGAAAWWLVVMLVGAAAVASQSTLLRLSPWFATPVLALLLKPTFAWRMLRDEVAAVEVAQGQGIAAARARLARLCSRDVTTLDAAAVRETAIETLAENLNDSLVAPLFWYVLFGLPGAAIYRVANTLDAMWGYRGPWEWAGKWAARGDDVLSWLPARLTALLLAPPSLRAAAREARLAASPNGGWPMAAMAQRLGVRLRKPGVYTLNAGAPSPVAAQTADALRIAQRAASTTFVLVTVLCGLRAVLS